jgi:parallel beta-helix repeat protein
MHHRHRPVAVFILAGIAGQAGSLWAVELNETARFAEPISTSADELGFAVALLPDAVLVTARSDGAGAIAPGWLRTWERDGAAWALGQRVQPVDGGIGLRFGASIAADGAYAVVGAARDDDLGEISGSAYVYARDANGWSLQTKRTAGGGIAFDEFGIAVALAGDELLVGARSDDDGGSQSGSVFVFRRSGTSWPQRQKLVAADDATKDLFGSAVALANPYALIGAPGDDTNTGSAYVFFFNGTNWSQQAKLIAADRAGGDRFGTAVALNQDYAAVGAPDDDGALGAVYIFERSGTAWSQVDKLTRPTGVADDAFGTSVAMRGDQLLVGAPGRDGARGAVYLYERSGATWVPLVTYTASDAAAGDRFGAGVAIGDGEAVVGAPSADGGAGAAYVLTTIQLDCNSNGIPDICDTSCLPVNPLTGASCGSTQGCGTWGDCNFNIIPDVCEPDCDTNGVADACQIAGGDPDCNTNGVPDACEPDCNANGIADDCDIANQPAGDCNANGVPDECELFADEVVLAADFESGQLPVGWIANGLWNVTTTCVSGVPCDGTHWAYFGLPGLCDFDTGTAVAGSLTAPKLVIPQPANRARLRYCSNYDGDRGIAPDGFDAAWVEVNGVIVDDVAGTVTTSFWETREIDLAPFAGQTVQIAWRFDSNDATFNNRLGWQVDAIEVIIDSDCDANGVIDVCDITGGEADCDSNGVPDACDVATGAVGDCNSNGVPDSCESATDCDTNGVIDFCETAIIYVDASAAGGETGLDWENAYTDLQDALLEADGLCVPVEIWVAAGTYAPAPPGGARSASFALRDNVAIFGGFSGTEDVRDQRNPDPLAGATILTGDLDGGSPVNNSYHVVTADGAGASAVLDGFIIRDGNANGVSPDQSGAGLLIVGGAPTVRNCLFRDHSAVAGAVAATGANPTFTDCIWLDNVAQFGGATWFEGGSNVTLTACGFYGNQASAGGQGGGLGISAGSTVDLTNCVISGNVSAGRGGGLYAQDSSTVTLTNCTLSENAAGSFGGGIFAFVESQVLTRNSILWANIDAGGSDETAQLDFDNATLIARYSIIQGWSGALAGIGNFSIDPLLADADGPDNLAGTLDDDLTLAPGSPAIDAGSNGANATTTDAAGLPRRIDDLATGDTGPGAAPVIDRGAFEFQADCNSNGQADSRDIAELLSIDCNLNFIPDECEIDRASPVPGGPYYCVFACDPDCNSNGVPDACDITGGTSTDCAGEGIPDECEPDCDANGTADSCEIAGGTDADCNANGVPDGCELAERDCDSNGQVDECELANPFTTVQSGPLGPVEPGTISSLLVPDARAAIGDVTLSFLATANLGGPQEFIDVRINGAAVGTVFATGANDCPQFPNQDQLVLTPQAYNALLTGGDALIELIPSDMINIIIGCDNTVSVAIQYLAFEDCNANGVPDACESDCNNNGIADECDISTGTSTDCNQTGTPDACDLSAGTSLDLNASGIPDECESDCDDNGVPDECDVSCSNTVVATGAACGVAFGASCGLASDCDANSVPDECDPDCDMDGVVDACAIAAGTAPDCDGNDIPDGCELAGADCDANSVLDDCESDADSDGFIDACDGCPQDPVKSAAGVCGCGNLDTDTDGDGVADCRDQCPGTPAAEPVDATGCPLYGACCFALGECNDTFDQAICELALSGSYQGNGTTCASDRDGDLVPNCDDPCPDDGAKIDPGTCGCGIADDDTDADGVADCLDLCPATAGGEPVDSNGCHLNGACCGPITGCLDDTYVDQAWCDATAGGWIYQGNGTTCALGCLPRQSGDYDADGDVDASDFAALPACLTGPIEGVDFLPPSALCEQVFDFDGDGDVDTRDYAAGQSAATP